MTESENNEGRKKGRVLIRVAKKVGLVVGIYAVLAVIMGTVYDSGLLARFMWDYRFDDIYIMIYILGPAVVMTIIGFIRNVILDRNLEKKQRLFTKIYSILVPALVWSAPNHGVIEKVNAARGLRQMDFTFGRTLYKIVVTGLYAFLFDLYTLLIASSLGDITPAMNSIILWVFFASLFTVVLVPVIYNAYTVIREIAQEHKREKRKRPRAPIPSGWTLHCARNT